MDLLAGIRRHQRKESAEGLSGERYLAIALSLQLMHLLNQRSRAAGQGVARTPAVEAERIPSAVAKRGHVGRCGRLEIFGIDRAAMAPDHRARRLLPAERGAGRSTRVAPQLRRRPRAAPQTNPTAN